MPSVHALQSNSFQHVLLCAICSGSGIIKASHGESLKPPVSRSCPMSSVAEGGKNEEPGFSSLFLRSLQSEWFGQDVLLESSKFSVLSLDYCDVHVTEEHETDEGAIEQLDSILEYCKLYGRWRFEGATDEEVSLIQEVQMFLLANIYQTVSDPSKHHFISPGHLSLVLEMLVQNVSTKVAGYKQMERASSAIHRQDSLAAECIFPSDFKDRVDGLVGSKHWQKVQEDDLASDEGKCGKQKTVASRILRKFSSNTEHTVHETEKELLDCVFYIFHTLLGDDIEKSSVVDIRQKPLIDAHTMKELISPPFLNLLVSFISVNASTKDRQEREQVRTLLLNVYKAARSFQVHVRNKCCDALQDFAFGFNKTPENDRSSYGVFGAYGVCELLKLLLEVIRCFPETLYREQRGVLFKTLLPLHRPAGLSKYGELLVQCVVEMLWKCPDSLGRYFQGLCSKWPVTSPVKHAMLHFELESLILFAYSKKDQKAMAPMFMQLCSCINDPHFHIAMDAIGIFEREEFVRILAAHRSTLVPMLIQALYQNTNGAHTHWHKGVRSASQAILDAIDILDMSLANKVKRKAAKRRAKHLHLKTCSGDENNRENDDEGEMSEGSSDRSSLDMGVFAAFSPKRSAIRPTEGHMATSTPKQKAPSSWWGFGKKRPVIPVRDRYVVKPEQDFWEADERHLASPAPSSYAIVKSKK